MTDLSRAERDAMESALKNALAILPSDYVRSGTPYEHMWRAGVAYAEQQREPEDYARHITWDHGRRTLCGQQVKGDPGDFYLPLGKAPRTDEGGAWCWSCLQLQDEAIAAVEQRHVEQQASADELEYLPVFRRALERIADVGYTTAKDATNIARKALADRPEPRDHDREALATVTGELERAEQQKAKLREALAPLQAQIEAIRDARPFSMMHREYRADVEFLARRALATLTAALAATTEDQ